jgi:hypothetical protein
MLNMESLMGEFDDPVECSPEEFVSRYRKLNRLDFMVEVGWI